MSIIRKCALLCLLCALAAPVAAQGTTVAVTASQTTILLGQGAQLTTTVKDAAGKVLGAPVTYQVDRPDVVSVSSSGQLSALALGDAVITARTSEGSASTTVHTYGLETVPGLYIQNYEPENPLNLVAALKFRSSDLEYDIPQDTTFTIQGPNGWRGNGSLITLTSDYPYFVWKVKNNGIDTFAPAFIGSYVVDTLIAGIDYKSEFIISKNKTTVNSPSIRLVFKPKSYIIASTMTSNPSQMTSWVKSSAASLDRLTDMNGVALESAINEFERVISKYPTEISVNHSVQKGTYSLYVAFFSFQMNLDHLYDIKPKSFIYSNETINYNH